MTSTVQDVEVRYCDQENINEFGTLNTRLLEIRAELKQCKEDVVKLEDAAAELMMMSDGKVMLLIGEAFIECTEDYANEYTEKKTEKIQAREVVLKKEEDEILKRQGELKKVLYGRFGDSINLEA